MDDLNASRATLAGGFLAAIAASACCLGPLVLLGLGVSGAWIANLTALEPYRPLSDAAALAFTALAWWRIYRARAAECAPGTVCARSRRLDRALFWLLAVLVTIAVGFPYVAPLFY